MFCPDCGRDCGEGNFCPDCGRSLKNKRKKLKFPPPPIGKYKCGYREYLVITEDAVVFYKSDKYCWTSFDVHAIPFEEIYKVYYRPLKKWKPGILSVRSVQNKLLPIATEFSVATDDRTAVTFGDAKINFERVYLFLKQCADIVNEAENL